MKDIYLGRLFGFEMVLKDVPDERYEPVKRIADKHLEAMAKAYEEKTFGRVNMEIEAMKSQVKIEKRPFKILPFF